MKVTLDFNFPEEREEMEFAVSGYKYFAVIQDVKKYIRTKIKCGELSINERKLLEEIGGLIDKELS